MECTIEIKKESKQIHSKERYRIKDPHNQVSIPFVMLVKEKNNCQKAITIPSSFWANHIRQTSSAKFHLYYNNWINETMFESNGTKIIQNENYQKIIQLGESVIPNIIDKYKTSQEHWSYALREITGIENGDHELQGNLNLIRQRWLSWASDNDY